jgi:putative PIN family toxin of toxin-antitoxin system
MPKAVLDSTVLVSAFLSKTGVSRELLRKAKAGNFTICLAEEILKETERKLLEYSRIRKRYPYTDEGAAKYVQLLRIVCQVVTELPKIKAVARDPNDDMIIACGIKAKAGYIVTRDKDMLDLKEYEQISIVSPEAFMVLVKH